VKLGAGGLVRAYTDAVAQALLLADKVVLQRQGRLTCAMPYDLEGLVRRAVEARALTLLHAQHGDRVVLVIGGAEEALQDLRSALDEQAGGQLDWLAPG
jgi:putative IMPACT (imprinted ancient) family translation regulator